MIENSSEIPLGSPPRVRGKAFAADALDAAAGITPACAGKRSLPSEKRNPVGDHPRVCGEKYLSPLFLLLLAGSPPRVRGKVPSVHKSGEIVGITPACAGKRCGLWRFSRHFWDHPRVCGEKYAQGTDTDNEAGSPPRVRGKAGSLDAVKVLDRITPACAGKSGAKRGRSAAGRDHPRVCGEKASASPALSVPCGSPPRVRGKD